MTSPHPAKMASMRFRVLTYTWAIDQPDWNCEHLHTWLSTQPPARWVQVVHRGRTEGFLDRDATGHMRLLSSIDPSTRPIECELDTRCAWPWTRLFVTTWLRRAHHAADEMTDVLAWAACSGLDHVEFHTKELGTHTRAARGAWWVCMALAAGPNLRYECADVDRVLERMRSWSDRLVEMCAPWAHDLALSSLCTGDRVLAADVATRITGRTADHYFPFDQARYGHPWMAVPWESAAAYVSMGRRKGLVLHGELWLPSRVVMRERLAQTATTIVNCVVRRSWSWFRTQEGVAWTTHPRVQAFLRDVGAAVLKLVKPSLAGSVPGRSGFRQDCLPPCVARTLDRPVHLSHAQRVRVWSSLLACGVQSTDVVLHIRRSIARMYPGVDGRSLSRYTLELTREVESLHRSRTVRGVTYEVSCIQWRSDGLASPSECAQCDRACTGDIEDLSTLRSPSQRYGARVRLSTTTSSSGGSNGTTMATGSE